MTETITNGSITSAAGFQAAGVACGLKAGQELDLALIYSDSQCHAACVFTTNLFPAAPVLYDRAILAVNRDNLRAVVINSGCANACTGEQGLDRAHESARLAADALSVTPNSVLVMSTGVIGAQLNMDAIATGIPMARQQLSRDGGHAAARAIMTTDTRPKEIAVRAKIGGSEVTIAGMAKGAGMIHPNMATMLSLITTDAYVEAALLDTALREAVDCSFNRITIDGDTSTNDTVLVLANGLAGNAAIQSDHSHDYSQFVSALTQVSTHLAHSIVRDGEGATKFVTITVEGAASEDQALCAAKSVAHSSLVKTALFGEDANWGRVICAVGYSGIEAIPERTALWFGDEQVVAAGQPTGASEDRLKEILSAQDIDITVNLGLGGATATVWTSDLSYDYVKINAHYRT
jgi:glutamate N-acetyltransferase/amino-acid N-acetyltransferase